MTSSVILCDLGSVATVTMTSKVTDHLTGLIQNDRNPGYGNEIRVNAEDIEKWA